MYGIRGLFKEIAMNYIEELNSKDNDNYLRYLKRMTDSMKVSTKGLIPFLTKDDKHILDVGCGSGILSIIANKLLDGNCHLVGTDIDEDCISSTYENF